jgi:hypothetical protein
MLKMKFSATEQNSQPRLQRSNQRLNETSAGGVCTLHENIAHDEIEKLVLGTLNNRLDKGPPGGVYLRMLLQKVIK